MNFKFFTGLVCLLGWLAVPGRAEESTGVTNVWQFTLPELAGESSPALAPDGTIYVGTFRGTLLAVTPEGRLKWQFKAGREIKSSPAVAGDGTVYFGSRNGKFYAVAADGKLKWTFTTSGWVDASPALATDGTIYFGSWDKNFYAVNPDGSLKWKFATSNLIDSSAAIGADGTVYFGSHDRNLCALAPDGKLKWQFATGAEITASPAISADGTIYFSSTDGNLYALSPNGGERWRLRTGGGTSSSPALDPEGNLYLMANNFHTAITATGSIRWSHPVVFQLDMSPAVAGGGSVYFSAPWRSLRALDCLQGASVWNSSLAADLYSSPVLDGRGIVYACDGHNLYAMKPITNAVPSAKSSWPQWRADPQHTGRVQK